MAPTDATDKPKASDGPSLADVFGRLGAPSEGSATRMPCGHGLADYDVDAMGPGGQSLTCNVCGHNIREAGVRPPQATRAPDGPHAVRPPTAAPAAHHLDGLNEAQRDAVLETSRSVLVLAGPGTGKTSMLVAKYAHLVIDKHVAPERILITTFTTKATAELEERIGKALAGARHYSKVEVANFHSFCLRLLQEHGADVGLRRDPTILDGLALTRFLHENRDRFEWAHVPYIRWTQGPLENLARFTGRCLSEGFAPEDALRRAERFAAGAAPDDRRKALEYTDYARNYAKVLDLLAQKQVLTYDLMLYRAVRLLEEHADVRKAVQSRFDYLLIDEVQDNNGLQTRLVELLAGGRPIVTVVGDEDQGIYKFRGARKDNLAEVQRVFAPRVVVLWENYRSSRHIVEAAKAVIARNPGRHADKRLEARGKDRDLDVNVEVLGVPDEDQEAIHIASVVAQEVAKGRKPKECAVILRSLNQKGRLLEELEARGIAYEVTSKGELLRLRDIRDLWAWLSVLRDPYTDNPSFERVLCGRETGLHLLDLGRIQHRLKRLMEEEAKAKGKDPKSARLNLVDILRDLEGAHIDPGSRDRLRWTRRAIETLSDKTRGLGALDTAYEVVGWLRPHLRHPPSEARSRQAWLNLARFLQLAKGYEQDYPDAAGLGGFLDYLDYLDRQGAEFEEADVDEAQDSVKVMTAHGAKGLQFPVVIVGSCCKQRFPGSFRGDWMHPILDPDRREDPRALHLEEERRVFFVALTRAEQRLVLTHPMAVGGKERARSEFLDELLDGAPQHAAHRVETVEIAPAEADGGPSHEWVHDLHAAATVHERVDGAEALERLRRVMKATLAGWKATLAPAVLHEVEARLLAAPFGLPAEPGAASEGDRERATRLYGASLDQDETDTLQGIRKGAELLRKAKEGVPPLRLSASALNTYASCPRKFQFQNVLHIPSRINAAAVAGSNVHRALEVFHREHKDDWRTASLDTLLATYERVAAEGRYGTPKEAEAFRQRDRKILAAYLADEQRNAGEPTHFEVPYTYEIPELNASFGGYIDRVDEHPDGTVEIVDYKTGSRDTPNKIVTEDYQIPLYVLAFEEGLGRKVKAGTLYWMRDAGDGSGPIIRDRIPRVPGPGKKGQFSDAAMAEFKARLGRTVEDIRQGRFTEVPDDFGCRFCDYRILCPAWGG